MKEKYCITIVSKILIVQFISNFIGLIMGCMLGIYIENKKWSQLIYKDIKIANIDLSGKTKEEARNIIKSQYIDSLLNKKLYVTVDDKVYTTDNFHLIKSYDMDISINKAFSFGKNLNMIEKHELIKAGCKKNYSINFTCNDDFIKTFTNNIEEEIHRNPVNAAISMNVEGITKISTDTKGLNIEEDELDKSIEDKIKDGMNEDIHIQAPIQNTEAAITQSKLSIINSCIASFNTNFESSSYMRANNIDICVKAINGTLLMPGELFSFNDVVGERTKERGYMEAPIIIGNKVESGIGGGICQVSSTLYNAILKAGIQHIERTRHSLPSSYIGLGLDATVAWGSVDLKFVNTLNYPIYIEGYTKNKNLYISIFSNSDLNKKKYIIENNITNDNNLYKAKVIRKTYENGILINSELISTDAYTPVNSEPKKSN